jgi:hypothetical protein
MTSCPLSQGHPCPQFFAKRHQAFIGKDVYKDFVEKIARGTKNKKVQ